MLRAETQKALAKLVAKNRKYAIEVLVAEWRMMRSTQAWQALISGLGSVTVVEASGRLTPGDSVAWRITMSKNVTILRLI
jgi:hypothetical protein